MNAARLLVPQRLRRPAVASTVVVTLMLLVFAAGYYGFAKPISAAPNACEPGDCNCDSVIDAVDLSALSNEIFDGDGSLATNAPGGTFPGSPSCDSNGDLLINVSDIYCTVQLIFNGPGACGP